MTGTRPRSSLALALIAACALYWALHLSAGDRGPIDWAVAGLLALAVLWNLARLGRRLHAAGGPRDVWHLLRTLLFWVLGVRGSGLVWPAEGADWHVWVGWALLVVAALDTVALALKERRALARAYPAGDDAPRRAAP